MKAIKFKCCPFCGGGVTKHPTKRWEAQYYACHHKVDCFLNNDQKSPFNFTLLPNNYMVQRWQERGK